MIEIKELSVVKAGRAICKVASWSVTVGECIGVVGGNGAGKSTLLRVLGGLEPNYQGQCRVTATQQEMTYVHQKPMLFRGTVATNVQYGLRVRRQSTAEVARVVSHWLAKLEMSSFASRSAHSLSGGEMRRVALARALALRPRLLLLDEPFADLDQQGIKQVCEVLNSLADTTIIVASPTQLPDDLCTTGSQFELSSA